jgi:2,3-bisphosphoglycerate-independent phosphoglycerate mutase
VKACLVVLGGGADRPHPALRGETPLRRARLPHLEALIRDGRLGTVRTTPPGREPGFETALPLLLGYGPGSIPAAGPLEALGTGRALRPDESAFLADFVTLRDGVLVDPSGGRPREAEAGVLRDAVNAALGGAARLEAGSATWRNVLLVAAEGAEATTVSSPHALSGLLLRGKEPIGPAGARIEEILRRAEGALAPHEVNAIRVDLRENPANALWCWGGGGAPALEPASERVGGRLVVVSRGGYARGLAEASGCEWVDAGPDEGEAAARALAALDGGADAAVLMLRSAEGASLTGDAGRKVAELERIDASVVGPLREGLAARGEHRLAACADVVLSTLDRRAFPDPVPFALAGTGVPASPGRGAAAFTEEAAAASDLSVDAAEDFLAYVMGR